MAPPVVELLKISKNPSVSDTTINEKHLKATINNNNYGSSDPINHSTGSVDSIDGSFELASGTTIALIWKDVIVLSVGFLCNFIAFNGISNVQSTLNSVNGLGTASQSVIYASLIISSFLLPPVMIKHLGCKWTIVCCIPFYTLYILANMYATWLTFMPTSILVGLAAAPLWSAKCSYLTTLSHRYVNLYNARQLKINQTTSKGPLTVESVNSRFFGVFFAIFHFDAIIGNLISSLTLSQGDTSREISHEVQCGISYCYSGSTPTAKSSNLSMLENHKWLFSNTSTALLSFQEDALNGTLLSTSDNVLLIMPDMNNVYTMCGIYSALSLTGCLLIAALLQPISGTVGCASASSLHGWQLLKVSLRQAINPFQLLMMPLTVFSGLAQSFMTSDFTKAFVACTLGIHFIGFVMICTGVTDAIFSLVFGVALKFVHRSVVYVIGAIICLALYVAMFLWIPTEDTAIGLYFIAAFWGIADSVWQTHFNAFYGILFPDNLEVAFASYRLWESIGYMTGFAWSDSVCVQIKLIVIVSLLVVGVITYAVVELKLRTRALMTNVARKEH